MGKLHEILAIEEDRRGKAKKIVSETTKTFKDKQNHFVSTIHVYKPVGEEEKDQVVGQTERVTTVNDKLGYTTNALVEYIDAFLQRNYQYRSKG